MDNIKITANQFDRVTPSQSGSKERDEGFVASQVTANKAQQETNVGKSDIHKQHNTEEVTDNRTNNLIEQRKRALAQHLTEKDKVNEQLKRNEELSAQRLIESRAAVNREKIKDSYDAVKDNDTQVKAEKIPVNESMADSSENNKNPINLVV